ncbi:major facilitator superfamily transporter [Ceratobasidium sp. AG-Ba]|nr:major facilitator superfamily transporter [Ceratobasidium sp. AG-Ba]QRW08478.1 major facilitator superfamily transporter [Ceratobasidium sp. AG-Ba]
MDIPLDNLGLHTNEKPIPILSGNQLHIEPPSNHTYHNYQHGPNLALRHEPLESSGTSFAPPTSNAPPEAVVESNDLPSTPEPSNLAPADRGLQAWMYLIGAFVVQTLVWGMHSTRIPSAALT